MKAPPSPLELARTREARRLLRRDALRARQDPVDFVRLVGRVEGNRPIRMNPVHELWHRILSAHDRAVIYAPVGFGKALPVDTPVATPSGFREIGEIEPGDTVLGGDGKPTRVTWCSPVLRDRVCYELTFKDGATIVADAEHQWSAWTTDDRDAGKPPRTVTTQEIVDAFETPSGRKRWSIPLAGPARFEGTGALPVHPYALGAWLGDGSTACGQLTFHERDREIVDRVAQLVGHGLGKLGRKPGTECCHQTPLGLRGQLARADVLGNKHVPQAYLVATERARRELLAGLLDTDGSCSGTHVEFCSTSRALADATLELARSLGYLATLREGRARLNGRDCGARYRVCWTATEQVFRLRRKADALDAALARAGGTARTASAKPRGRTIVSWREVPSVPVRCIAVEAEHHTYLATRDYVVTHNSNHITRWRLLYEMMRNPNIRIGVVSVSKGGVPAKFMSAIKADITDNRWLHLVAPHLKRGRGDQQMWSTKGLIIERDQVMPDPTIQIFGLYGKILGSRLDLIILDDVCNLENTITQHSRDKMAEWVMGEVLSRIPPTGGRVWAVGHVWDKDDILARLARKPGWYSRKFSAFLRDPRNPTQELPLIPSMWKIDRLLQREIELGPYMSKLMLRNELPDKSSGRIRLHWFDRCLARGVGLPMERAWNPMRAPVFTGVDVATGSGLDLTAAVTAVVLPNGDRRIIDIRSGDWTGPEILEQLADITRCFGSQITVESNAAQKYLHQFARSLSCLALSEHATGVNKRHQHYGIEGLGTEISQGKWILPSDSNGIPARTQTELDHPATHIDGLLAKAITGLVAYTPDPKVHTVDESMAWWICREAIRTSPVGTGYSNIAETLDGDMWNIDTLAR